MKNRNLVVLLSVACAAMLTGSGTAWAQGEEQGMPQMSAEEKAMMEAWDKAAKVGPQQETLAGMAGDWTFEGTFWMAPDQPPMTTTGTATRTMILGGRVLVEKVTSSFMGQPFEGHGMTGYDNVAGTYWSTWMDNMSTALMTSTGTCDDMGKCEFHSTMTDPMTGQPSNMRMTSEHHPDSEVHRSYEVRDGEEHLSMELEYTRVQ